MEVAAADQALAAAVVEEVERVHLWRAIVGPQTRRILIDGPLPPRIELEPVTAIVSLTMWTPTDDAAVIGAASYHVISRDPQGTVIEPLPWYSWPSPERSIGSFSLTYTAGWVVTPESSPGAGDAAINMSPPQRSPHDREGHQRFVPGAGLGDISVSAASRLGLDSRLLLDRPAPPLRLPASGAPMPTDRALISSQAVDDA